MEKQRVRKGREKINEEGRIEGEEKNGKEGRRMGGGERGQKN